MEWKRFEWILNDRMGQVFDEMIKALVIWKIKKCNNAIYTQYITL